MPRKHVKKRPKRQPNDFQRHLTLGENASSIVPTPGLRCVWRHVATLVHGECLGILRRGKNFFALVPFDTGGITEVAADRLAFFRGEIRPSLWPADVFAKLEAELAGARNQHQAQGAGQ